MSKYESDLVSVSDRWDMVPLGLVSEVTLGKMIQNEPAGAGDNRLPFLHAANVRDHGVLDPNHSHKEMWFSPSETESLQVKAGDVVVVEGGAVGKSAYVETDLEGYGFQNSILRVRCNPNNMVGTFLQYCLQSAYKNGDIQRVCTAVSLAHFPAEKVNRFRVPLPPLDTQKRIADYLDRETAEMDEMIQDLDVYVEQLNDRKRTVTNRLVLGADLPGDRRPLNDVIGSIPASWTKSQFSLEFSESSELNGNEPVGELLSISEYYGIIVNTRGTEGQQSSEDVSHYRVVRPNQLAANMMWLDHGGLGVSKLSGHISPDHRAFNISERIHPAYAHYLLRSKNYVDHFSTISVGVRPNAKRTTKTTLGMTPIPIPPMEEQKRIADELEDQISQIDVMINDSTTLRAQLLERRTVLITEVVTGRKEI